MLRPASLAPSRSARIISDFGNATDLCPQTYGTCGRNGLDSENRHRELGLPARTRLSATPLRPPEIGRDSRRAGVVAGERRIPSATVVARFSPSTQSTRSLMVSINVRFTPKKRTLELSRAMSALCQKRTFIPRRPHSAFAHCSAASRNAASRVVSR